MIKLEQWKMTIDEWQPSGLSQKTFCQNHNLKKHTLHYWIRKLNKGSDPTGKFIPFTEKFEPTDLKLN